jgi:outer membrane protein assembly factor BamB
MSDMTGGKATGGTAKTVGLSRRAVLLAPLALTGCEMVEGWFTTKKDPLPGKREPLGAIRRGFTPDENAPRVALPAAVRSAAWAQAGGNPTHLMGHLSLGNAVSQAWTADLGVGGGYRRKLLARPVVSDGVVFAMDSNARVSAFTLNAGARLWRTETVSDDLDSTNVGGGLCWDGGTLFAVNGVSELLALDPAKGTVKWRRSIDVPARSAPTVADGKVFLTTIDSKLLALSAADGHVLWSYQATQTPTTILGGPAPAYAQGIVVAGFGSGELAALRVESGGVIWTDGLGVTQGRSALADFLAIRGDPVISNGQVYASGLGGLTIAADLLTGRRVWERRVASINTPYLAGSWMFVISTEQEIGAINIDDSRVSWVASLPRWENPEKKKNLITWYGPIAAGGRLVALGSNHEALFLNPSTGETVHTQTLSDAPAPFAPTIVEGTMLVVTDDGRLTAWR